MQNPGDLDCAAKLYGIDNSKHNLPVQVFWDFAAAFPSLSQRWLALCFRGIARRCTALA